MRCADDCFSQTLIWKSRSSSVQAGFLLHCFCPNWWATWHPSQDMMSGSIVAKGFKALFLGGYIMMLSQTSTLMGLCCWVMTHGGKQRQRAAKAIVGEDSMTRCWRLQERGWDFRWYIVGSVFILFSICNSIRITNVCLCHVLGIYKSWINLQVDLLHMDLSTSSFLNLSLLNFIFDINGRPFFLLNNLGVLIPGLLSAQSNLLFLQLQFVFLVNICFSTSLPLISLSSFLF